MKHTKLASAVGLMLAATSMQAWALLPGAVPDDAANGANPQTGNRLYVSGATATDQVLGRIFIVDNAAAICAPGTIDIYTTVGPQAGNAAGLQAIFGAPNKAILCTASASTSQAGTPIGMFKESVGGSQNGVDPPALGSNLTPAGAPMNFLNLGSGGATGCAAPVAFPAIAGQTVAFQVHYSCATLQQRAPHVGVSDVNPELLTTNAAAVAALTASPTVDILFSHAVTLRLYRELQANQGFESVCGNDNNGFEDGDATNDCDEAINVPSLTKAQLRGLLTGAIPSWNLLTDDNATALPNSTVFLCRRGETSGTQATFESVMLNERCVQGVLPMAPPDQPACEAGGCTWVTNAANLGNTVFANTGSGDVRNCLNAHDDNGTDRAIGILSTESSPPNINSNGPDGNQGTTTDRGWRYIGMNRANPDLESAGEGNYELWVENTWNVPANNPVNNDPTTPAVDRSAIQDALQSDIHTNFGNLTVLINLNEGFRWVTGDGGLLGIPNIPNSPPTPPFTEATWRANPVNPATRSPLGPVNDCNPPVNVLTTTEAGGVDEENVTAQGGPDYQ